MISSPDKKKIVRYYTEKEEKILSSFFAFLTIDYIAKDGKEGICITLHHPEEHDEYFHPVVFTDCELTHHFVFALEKMAQISN